MLGVGSNAAPPIGDAVGFTMSYDASMEIYDQSGLPPALVDARLESSVAALVRPGFPRGS